jgi:hypothetical protein
MKCSEPIRASSKNYEACFIIHSGEHSVRPPFSPSLVPSSRPLRASNRGLSCAELLPAQHPCLEVQVSRSLMYRGDKSDRSPQSTLLALLSPRWLAHLEKYPPCTALLHTTRGARSAPSPCVRGGLLDVDNILIFSLRVSIIYV